MELRYAIAPLEWSFSDPNPFTPDGSYGSEWSAFCLLDAPDDQLLTGQSGYGPFAARFGRGVPDLPTRLADYLRYENAQGRAVILSFPPDVDAKAYVAQALAGAPHPGSVRPTDPAVLVHSTTRAARESIQADGELKAASLLAHRRQASGEASAPDPLADYLRHEPAEYGDYIMFGEMDSYFPELVVASYAAGRFIMDPNCVYRPGVRLYIDHHRLVRDGLGTRDGLHLMKVHLRLPLRPYLHAAIGVDEIDPQGQVQDWTVQSFVTAANAEFRARVENF